MEAIQAEIISLLSVVIVALFGLITQKVTSYLKAKGIVAKLESNKELVKIAVDAVEQVYGHLDGDKKLELAKEEIVELMQEKKIKISEREIDALIESIIKEMKDSVKKELDREESAETKEVKQTED